MKLFDLGCICHLSISKWTGEVRLSREDMKLLGLNPEVLPPEITKTGKKALISPVEFTGINRTESRARKFLAANGQPFLSAGSFFVPKKIFPTVETQLISFKTDFNKVVDEFMIKFDVFKDKLKQKYPEFWEKTLKKAYPNNPKSLREKFDFRFSFFKIDSIDEARKQEMQKEVQQFVSEYVNSMRQKTVEFCQLMEARINGKPYGNEEEAKQLTGRTLNSFRKYVENFSKLNIFGDSEIQQMLQNFKKEFVSETTSSESFDNDVVKSSALSALNAIKLKAESLDETSKFVDSLKRKIEL